MHTRTFVVSLSLSLSLSLSHIYISSPILTCRSVSPPSLLVVVLGFVGSAGDWEIVRVVVIQTDRHTNKNKEEEEEEWKKP